MSKNSIEKNFYQYVNFKEGVVHEIAKYMVYIYFIKRAMELILIHRLAGRLTSLTTIMWQALGYWIGLSLIVGHSIYKPDYVPSSLVSDQFNREIRPLGIICIGIFAFAQIMSLLC